MKPDFVVGEEDMKPSEALVSNRAAIRHVVESHRARNARVLERSMRDDLVDTLRDCANALGELLPRDHAHRKLVDQANRLLDRYDQSSPEQQAADALRLLMHSLPHGTQSHNQP